jgi:hypothetical protein
MLLAGNAHSAVLSRTNWTIFYVDSHETVKDNGAVVNATDGNANSIWHSAWYPTDAPVPHEVQIDLRSVHNINGFRYLPRPDAVDHVTGGNVDYGRVAQYEIYVSMSSGAWGAPVATGTFPNTAAEQEVLFTTKLGQYVRFRAITEVKGRPWTSAAELNVLGAATTAANYTVTGMLPGGNGTIACQPSVSHGGSASCTITANLGYVLTGLQDNWTNVFSQVSGTNPYTFTINNATSNHTVLAALGATTGAVIPKSGWSLVSVDAQEAVKAYNIGQYAFDSDPVTIWHTRWYPSIAPLPHQIVIDMGTAYNVSGFRYLPRQDGIVTGRIVQYELYVSSSTGNWGTAVATGLFANDAAQKEVQFGAKTGRYLRFVATAEGAGNQYVAVAELTALRSGAPTGPTPTFASATGTPVRTSTPVPTSTPTPTLTPGGGATPTATATATQTLIATPAATGTQTMTATITPMLTTATPTPTVTPSFSSIPTFTASPVPTRTPVAKSKCDAGKMQCVAAKQACLLIAHARAERNGEDVEIEVRDRCTGRFEGVNNDFFKGCIGKLVAREDDQKPDTLCTVPGSTDLAALGAKVDAFVADVVSEIDPQFPTFQANDCNAGKKTCMWKTASCLLQAALTAVKKSEPVDDEAVQKCKTTFSDASKPEKGCIAKLEARADRNPGKPKKQCSVRHNTGSAIQALEDKIDAFVADVVNEITLTLP